MKFGKIERQSRLLQLIRDQVLATQEEAAAALAAAGMEVTQATVSRDIKELGILKVATADGRARYMAPERSGEGASGRLMMVFAQAVTDVRDAGNLIVVKTLPGMAQAAAAALDSMRLTQIVGSIAGDDTIFVATPSLEAAASLGGELRRLASLSTSRA